MLAIFAVGGKIEISQLKIETGGLIEEVREFYESIKVQERMDLLAKGLNLNIANAKEIAESLGFEYDNSGAEVDEPAPDSTEE